MISNNFKKISFPMILINNNINAGLEEAKENLKNSNFIIIINGRIYHGYFYENNGTKLSEIYTKIKTKPVDGAEGNENEIYKKFVNSDNLFFINNDKDKIPPYDINFNLIYGGTIKHEDINNNNYYNFIDYPNSKFTEKLLKDEIFTIEKDEIYIINILTKTGFEGLNKAIIREINIGTKKFTTDKNINLGIQYSNDKVLNDIVIDRIKDFKDFKCNDNKSTIQKELFYAETKYVNEINGHGYTGDDFTSLISTLMETKQDLAFNINISIPNTIKVKYKIIPPSGYKLNLAEGDLEYEQNKVDDDINNSVNVVNLKKYLETKEFDINGKKETLDVNNCVIKEDNINNIFTVTIQENKKDKFKNFISLIPKEEEKKKEPEKKCCNSNKTKK